MTTVPPNGTYEGYAVPPSVYEVGFDWDASPEVDKLMLLARSHGVQPKSALELGCGVGRLVRALRQRVGYVCGIDLSSDMVNQGLACEGDIDLKVGDMSDFNLARRFDLIHTSANTVRHVTTDAAIAGMWQCIAAHLEPGGLFIADLELGFKAEGVKLNRPSTWTISRKGTTVCVGWRVVGLPGKGDRCCTVQLVFEARGNICGTWSERFPLRTYDAPEFVRMAREEGGLDLCGLFEVRDPYLFERSPEQAEGRFLVVLRRTIGD